jgi:hypothetical protein
MIYINTTIEEDFLIKDHLWSLITLTGIIINNKTIVDKFWKNWYQIFKDYQYYLEIINESKVLDSIVNLSAL